MRTEVKYALLAIGCITVAMALIAAGANFAWATFLVLTASYFQNRAEFTRPLTHREIATIMLQVLLGVAVVVLALVFLIPKGDSATIAAIDHWMRTPEFLVLFWLLAMVIVVSKLRRALAGQPGQALS